MSTVDQQIQSAADAISENIDALAHDRALLAQNILSQLRNLVEGIAVRLHAGRGDVEFQYSAVGPALTHVGARAMIRTCGWASARWREEGVPPEQDLKPMQV